MHTVIINIQNKGTNYGIMITCHHLVWPDYCTYSSGNTNYFQLYPFVIRTHVRVFCMWEYVAVLINIISCKMSLIISLLETAHVVCVTTQYNGSNEMFYQTPCTDYLGDSSMMMIYRRISAYCPYEGKYNVVSATETYKLHKYWCRRISTE
jgi:hypothetical protein